MCQLFFFLFPEENPPLFLALQLHALDAFPPKRDPVRRVGSGNWGPDVMGLGLFEGLTPEEVSNDS